MTNCTFAPVMILGCGRSGTSIFGELFEHLAEYHYRSEPPFVDVMNADYSVPLAFKVPHESGAFGADPGLSFPLAALRKHAPKMKFFWIVRHPLDTVCSLRIGISQEWGHHPRPPDWRDWLNRPLVERCAYHWAFLNSVGFAHVSKIADVVRFEDLISAPGEFAQNVCRTLDLDSLDQAAAVQHWAGRVQNTNNAGFIEAKTSRAYSRPDHSVRVERWRHNLSKDDIDRVVPIVAEAARQFGYRLGTVR